MNTVGPVIAGVQFQLKLTGFALHQILLIDRNNNKPTNLSFVYSIFHLFFFLSVIESAAECKYKPTSHITHQIYSKTYTE